MTFQVRALAPASPEQPTPTLWSGRPRGSAETRMDSESAIALACHLSDAFDRAASWSDLVARLGERGFLLRFEDTRLALVHRGTGASLCTCATLGQSFAVLKARLGKPRVHAETRELVSE